MAITARVRPDTLRATREAYADALVELGGSRPEVVVLDCDLSKSTGSAKFGKAFPERFVNCGVAEQSMMGAAAGLAASGKICFTGSFAIFAVGRAYEQVRNTVAYCKLNVKVCPSHAGVTVGPDGGSHQSVEDIALMRGLPNMAVVVPADYWQAKAAVLASADIPGPVYVRMGRPKLPGLFDSSYRFELGRADLLCEGTDVTIVAAGVTVFEALSAAGQLAGEGISAEVINMASIKPFDAATLLESAAKTGAVLTVEEHSIIGGLGSAVAEVLGESLPTPLKRLGLRDCFGTSGESAELLDHFGISAPHIVAAVKAFALPGSV